MGGSYGTGTVKNDMGPRQPATFEGKSRESFFGAASKRQGVGNAFSNEALASAKPATPDTTDPVVKRATALGNASKLASFKLPPAPLPGPAPAGTKEPPRPFSAAAAPTVATSPTPKPSGADFGMARSRPAPAVPATPTTAINRAPPHVAGTSNPEPGFRGNKDGGAFKFAGDALRKVGSGVKQLAVNAATAASATQNAFVRAATAPIAAAKTGAEAIATRSAAKNPSGYFARKARAAKEPPPQQADKKKQPPPNFRIKVPAGISGARA